MHIYLHSLSATELLVPDKNKLEEKSRFTCLESTSGGASVFSGVGIVVPEEGEEKSPSVCDPLLQLTCCDVSSTRTLCCSSFPSVCPSVIYFTDETGFH